MNRRGFLQLLSTGAIGAATLDIDRLLWIPGQKTFFLPPAPLAFDATSLASITHEALRVFTARFTAWEGFTPGLSPRLSAAGGTGDGPTLDAWKEVRTLTYEGDTPDTIKRQIIPPLATMLAVTLKGARAQTFGVLPANSTPEVEIAVATDPIRGVSLRGRRWYDVHADASMLSFDVLAGA